MPPAARTGPYATVSASPKRSGGAISPVGARRLRSTRAWAARASEDSCRRSSLTELPSPPPRAPHPPGRRPPARTHPSNAPSIHRSMCTHDAVRSHQRPPSTVPAAPAAAPATTAARRRRLDAEPARRRSSASATALGAQLLSSCTGSPANCSRSWHPQCRHGSASQFYVAEWLPKGSAGASAASAAGARACLSVCLSLCVCLCACLCVCVSVCLSVCMSVCACV